MSPRARFFLDLSAEMGMEYPKESVKSIICACMLVCLDAGGLAIASDEGEFSRCRQITESAGRLACYDAVPLPKGEESVSGCDNNLSGTERSQAVRMNAASLPAKSSANSSIQRFGLPVATTTTPELEQLESVISGRFDGWLARGLIQLANGQVWEVTDGSEAAYELKNPRVLITHGMSGTFFMQIEGVSQTPRVRRIR